jgi:SAM-dependent methyltransferase
MDGDKQTERERYDARARSQLIEEAATSSAEFGAAGMPAYLRAPYLLYEAKILELVNSRDRVLELGAGSGLHTLSLLKAGAHVIATDISPRSLELLSQRMNAVGVSVETQVADMEALPFADDSFDVVACAGSLSYGSPELVDSEIRRVLRAGGLFICVDSLNHNPIYRFNRLIHCYRGKRTRSTLERMPGLGRIRQISRGFLTAEAHYFGALSFAMPLLSRVIGGERARLFSDYFDRIAQVKRSAFKFVLIAEALEKS